VHQQVKVSTVVFLIASVQLPDEEEEVEVDEEEVASYEEDGSGIRTKGACPLLRV
jgi:hypothetical protein